MHAWAYMRLLNRAARAIVVGFALIAPGGGAAGALKINGSTTVNLPAAEAAEILRAEKKLNIQVDTQGGSSGGIAQVGEDAVALIVSKDVYEGGVRSLTKQQAKDVYESKVTNWKDLGGPDQRI